MTALNQANASNRGNASFISRCEESVRKLTSKDNFNVSLIVASIAMGCLGYAVGRELVLSEYQTRAVFHKMGAELNRTLDCMSSYFPSVFSMGDANYSLKHVVMELFQDGTRKYN